MRENPLKFVKLLANAPRNCWVALNDEENRVAGFGSTILEALEQARKAGVKNPLVLWSPGAAQAANVNGNPRLTVLVVDDEDDVRELICGVLEAEGYAALPAGSAEMALQLAKGNPIDVLLTDVLMPGMNGRQLAERIGTLRPATKMLFMSGHASDPLVDNLIGKYEMCFLRKPFSRGALMEKMRWVLEEPEACKVPAPEESPSMQPPAI